MGESINKMRIKKSWTVRIDENIWQMKFNWEFDIIIFFLIFETKKTVKRVVEIFIWLKSDLKKNEESNSNLDVRPPENAWIAE